LGYQLNVLLDWQHKGRLNAEETGTTCSRASFFMNRFRKLGFIKYNGGLQVHSSLLNIILHD
jgi:CRP/FNR family cyclic AMP-dependent transcriptional regulator